MSDQPHRAFRLTFSMESDTRDDLVSSLLNLATRVDRDEVTTGVCGGCSSGEIYELLVDPSKTHDSYFAELKAHLAKQKAAA